MSNLTIKIKDLKNNFQSHYMYNEIVVWVHTCLCFVVTTYSSMI